MKKLTLLSIFVCLFSFFHTEAQTCTIINNTTFDYKHVSAEMDPSLNRNDIWYFVPASSTISFLNSFGSLAGGVPGAGAHFVKCSTVETPGGTWIGALYSDLASIAYWGSPFLMTSFVNPLTGNTCTLTEAYNASTGEHDVTITIN